MKRLKSEAGLTDEVGGARDGVRQRSMRFGNEATGQELELAQRPEQGKHTRVAESQSSQVQFRTCIDSQEHVARL